MPSTVRYSETLRMERSTFLQLTGVFAAASAPLAVVAWVYWRPLGVALVAALMAALAAVFWLARWQIQVRTDGFYYRVIPFLPVWRTLASTGETVDATVERRANGRRVLDDEGALFPWSSGTRTIAMNVDGGVRIHTAGGADVFVSSYSPEELASAVRSVAR